MKRTILATALPAALPAAITEEKSMSNKEEIRDKGKTHYEGCWREPGHHDCAVAEVERLTRELDAAYEKAAKECENHAEYYALWDGGCAAACDDCAEAVRNLKNER